MLCNLLKTLTKRTESCIKSTIEPTYATLTNHSHPRWMAAHHWCGEKVEEDDPDRGLFVADRASVVVGV